MRNFMMTSETVTEGHPDKLCDQISDAVIDACLATGSRTGIIAECAMTSGVTFLSVRSSEEIPVDLAALARRVMAEAGYEQKKHARVPTVMLELSHDAALSAETLSAGRARHMVTAFGYACSDNGRAMPLPILVAHDLVRALDAARRDYRLSWLSPDAQAQVAVRFEDRQPVGLSAIALNVGTRAAPESETIREALLVNVVGPVMTKLGLEMEPETRFVVFPAHGEAGPDAHSGLTGRKSADDFYGNFTRSSGSALSGKDPSRIDRIASYAARQAARAVVAAGLARECELQLSYIVGDEAPASVEIDTFQSGRLDDAAICRRVRELFDFRVGAIAERMGLWDLPAARDGRFYRDFARYGHMGRDELSPPWEDVSCAEKLA